MNAIPTHRLIDDRRIEWGFTIGERVFERCIARKRMTSLRGKAQQLREALPVMRSAKVRWQQALAKGEIFDTEYRLRDLGLPDESGFDVMRQIQRTRPFPGIALTGYGLEKDVREALEAGFFATSLSRCFSIDSSA